MREIFRQFFNPQRLRFMAVGLVMTAINLTIMLFFVEVLDCNMLVVNLWRMIGMTFVRFGALRQIVWSDTELPILAQLLRYLANRAFSIAAKQGLYLLLISAGVSYWAAYLVCTALKGIANYKTLSSFVFRKRRS